MSMPLRCRVAEPVARLEAQRKPAPRATRVFTKLTKLRFPSGTHTRLPDGAASTIPGGASIEENNVTMAMVWDPSLNLFLIDPTAAHARRQGTRTVRAARDSDARLR